MDGTFSAELLLLTFYSEFKGKYYLLPMPILELAHALRELDHLPSDHLHHYIELFLPHPFLPLVLT